MATQMHFPESWDDFGPKMQALNERERKFCWAYVTAMMAFGGDASAADAAREAGYSDASGAAKVRANELLHRERVQEALDELAQREMRGLALPALLALKRVMEDPQHRDHVRAILAVLNRVGMSERTEAHVTVTHQVDAKDVETLVRRLAQESGIDPRKLLGRDAQ